VHAGFSNYLLKYQPQLLPHKLASRVGTRARSGKATTDPNHIAGFKAQNGAGTKSEMGKGSEGVTAGSDDSENNGLGSRKALMLRVAVA
jgi:hypothetical protein